MQVDDVGKGMRAVETFPLQRSSQFTMSPYLIGSKSDGESLKDRIQVSKGSLRDGDMLLLATDAMAAWLLKRHEEGRPLWKWLYRKLGTLRALPQWSPTAAKMDCATTTSPLSVSFITIHGLKRRRASDGYMARSD